MHSVMSKKRTSAKFAAGRDLRLFSRERPDFFIKRAVNARVIKIRPLFRIFIVRSSLIKLKNCSRCKENESRI